MISHYDTGKASSKRFQLWFSAHHKKSVKTNENQSIITKQFNPIVREKSHHGLLWFQLDPSRLQELPE